MNPRIYGYFSTASQDDPEYDPGFDVHCPICGRRLSFPVNTISLMAENDSRSYFYRVHQGCYARLTDEQITALDSQIIDAIAAAGNVN